MIHVVIPTHNRPECLVKCLQSLNEQTTAFFTTTVVDTGSDKQTNEILANDDAAVVIHGNGQMWWSAAVNAAISQLMESFGYEDHILLLNDDVVLHPEYIEHLKLWIKQYPRDLFGSRVRFMPDRITGMVKYGSWWTASRYEDHGWGPPSTISGRGMIVPVGVFKKIGLFDERHLPQAGADEEFAIRASRNGFRIHAPAGIWLELQDNPGHISYNKHYSLQDAREYFFGKKSYSNLTYMFWFSWLTRKNPIQAMCFYLAWVARVTIKFALKLK
jgi:N-acetylglucosaminyl-diphospho-decaprenol L-rhamnosyltransferase